MVNKPLIHPYFWGVGTLGGGGPRLTWPFSDATRRKSCQPRFAEKNRVRQSHRKKNKKKKQVKKGPRLFGGHIFLGIKTCPIESGNYPPMN